MTTITFVRIFPPRETAFVRPGDPKRFERRRKLRRRVGFETGQDEERVFNPRRVRAFRESQNAASEFPNDVRSAV